MIDVDSASAPDDNNTLHLYVQPLYYDCIADHKKLYEGRLHSAKMESALKEKTYVRFERGKGSGVCPCLDQYLYKSKPPPPISRRLTR